MNELEQLLQAHRRPCRVAEVRYAPQVVRVRLEPLHHTLANGGRGLYTKVAHLQSLRRDLAAGLGVPHVMVTTDAEGIWLEVPREGDALILASSLHPNVESMTLPVMLGQAVDGSALAIDLSQPHTPHVLVGGTTGSGKTMLLHAMVYSLVTRCSPRQVQLVLVDSNAICLTHSEPTMDDGLGVWRRVKHVRQVVTTPLDTLEVLEDSLVVIRRRYGGKKWRTHLVLVLDELSDVLSDPLHGDDILAAMVRILEIGRKVGVHVVAATHRPSAKVVSGAAKVNFPVRIALAVGDPVDSRIILGRGGAEVLSGKGDALVKVGMQVTRIQGALVRLRDIEALVNPKRTTPTQVVAQARNQIARSKRLLQGKRQ